ncbi:LPS export ABC transporter periplasmic protein LptC [bacterium]|nr:LPS export ABC transporter periplasmic protein LptC [bacterium]
MQRKVALRSFTILKWIPRLLMVGLIGFSAYVYWNYGRTETKDSGVNPPRPPGRVTNEVKGIEYIHFDKGLKVYQVKAKRNKKFRNESQQLERPLFIFFDENQKETIRVTGKKCNISRDFNTITVIDDVVVKSQTDMTVTSNLLRYDSRLRQFHTSSPSRFHWKTMNGKARGFVYKIEEEMLVLPQDPQIQYINKASENRQPILVTGMRGAVDRKNGFAYFDENVEVTQGRDWIHADRIEVSFKASDNDVEKIVARNNVKIKFARPGKGKQKAGETPAVHNAGVTPALPTPVLPIQAPRMSNVFTADETSGKDLDADQVELFFFEDGSTIRSFHSTGNCTFVLHTFDKRNKPFEHRIIKGDRFDASFNGAGDMEEFHASDNVSVTVQPAGPARRTGSPQTIYCRDLNATFVPATGDVKEIHFNGEFKHVQNERTVSSERAIYYGKEGKTDLIGSPQIQDTSLNITSEKMFLYEQTSAIHADGNVKSEFVKKEGKTPTTFPFASPSNQPVYISAEKMDWDSNKSEAVYTGKAKLWQEKNVITAAKMTINDKEKTLSAYDKVHTIFYNQKEGVAEEVTKAIKKEKKKAAETASAEEENKLMVTPEKGQDGPISVDAAIMNYVEKDRIIHFEKDVKVITPSTKINSEKADFYLKEKSSEFDRLYAQGKVTIQTEQKRGSGKMATFFAGDRRLILEGNPKLSEPGKADILGHVLTLFLADGRILIDGQEDGRATTTLEMLETASNPLASPKSPSKKVPDAGSKDRKPNQKL